MIRTFAAAIFELVAAVITVTPCPAAAADAFESGYNDGSNERLPSFDYNEPSAWADYQTGYAQGQAEVDDEEADVDEWLKESANQTRRRELRFGANPCPDFFRDLCRRTGAFEVFRDVGRRATMAR